MSNWEDTPTASLKLVIRATMEFIQGKISKKEREIIYDSHMEIIRKTRQEAKAEGYNQARKEVLEILLNHVNSQLTQPDSSQEEDDK